MSILIVGVTGVLGRHTAGLLLAEGHAVSGLTREPARAADLAASGVEILQGDLIDCASLERACEGIDAVLASAHQLRGTPPHTSEAVDDRGHRTLIDVALAAGVKRFVYLSARGASHEHPVDFYRTKASIEDRLRSSGLRFTILRPSAFMEWHVHRLLGAELLATGHATLYGAGDNPVNFVAGSDVAQVAATALTTDVFRDATVEIGGPDNITKNQVAALYAHLADLASSTTHVPIAGDGLPPDPVLARLLAMSRWLDTVDQAFDPPVTSVTCRRASTRVEAFVRDQVDAFRGAG